MIQCDIHRLIHGQKFGFYGKSDQILIIIITLKKKTEIQIFKVNKYD